MAPARISWAGISGSLDFVRDVNTRQSSYSLRINMTSEKTAWQHAKPFVNGGLSGMYVFWHRFLSLLCHPRPLLVALLLADASPLSSVRHP